MRTNVTRFLAVLILAIFSLSVVAPAAHAKGGGGKGRSYSNGGAAASSHGGTGRSTRHNGYRHNGYTRAIMPVVSPAEAVRVRTGSGVWTYLVLSSLNDGRGTNPGEACGTTAEGEVLCGTEAHVPPSPKGYSNDKDACTVEESCVSDAPMPKPAPATATGARKVRSIAPVVERPRTSAELKQAQEEALKELRAKGAPAERPVTPLGMVLLAMTGLVGGALVARFLNRREGGSTT